MYRSGYEPSDRPSAALELEFEGGGEEPLLIRAVGDLDVGGATALLRRTLDGAGARGGADLILDLSRVGFIDSTGLRVVLALEREVSRRSGQVVLNSPSRSVRRLLSLAGLDERMVIASSLDEARSALEHAVRPPA